MVTFLGLKITHIFKRHFLNSWFNFKLWQQQPEYPKAQNNNVVFYETYVVKNSNLASGSVRKFVVYGYHRPESNSQIKKHYQWKYFIYQCMDGL